jgi:4'-phosphopantetheinyl transferase
MPTIWFEPAKAQAAMQRLMLEHDQVDVWLARLDLQADSLGQLRRALSADERARADRFYFPRDRDRFVAARGMLREILSRYLEGAPGTLRFSYNAYGKPALLDADGLCFNLSHSHDLAIYAVARRREVGIDIEHIRADFAGEGIAERFFSAGEIAALQALPAEQRVEGFFNCWTRKEAYIKARGEGLSLALDRFDVSIAPGAPARLLAVRGEPDEVESWTLCALDSDPGYVAALVVAGQGWQMRYRRWTV